MSAIFPKWTNRLPLLIVVGGGLVATAVTAGVWYYFTPKYFRVGYQPIQPVAFSHATHAGQLGIDCRYCHNAVEKSWFSNIPSSSTCMNCHNQVLKGDPRLALVSESAATGKPIPWVQIHRVPDFAYFNHSAHVNKGVGCSTCHGRVDQMPLVWQEKSLQMEWCLECHRNPERFLRPKSEVYNIAYEPPANQLELGRTLVKDYNVKPQVTCSTCHR